MATLDATRSGCVDGPMERISSGTTFFYKQVFPVLWFGFLAVIVAVTFVSTKGENGPPLFVLVVAVFLCVIGLVVMEKLIWDLADEVQDAGDRLIVRFGNEQEQIPLSNIINVGYTYLTNPARVTLTLRTPCRFGDEVSFCPPARFIPFARSPVIDGLIRRVDAARQAAK